ncbi:MAG: NnrU family protein [Burkholderiales bacterium]
MDPMLNLVVACAAFLALHVLPSTPLRAALVGRLGEGPYSGLFSLATLGAIVWMALAYRAAPLAFLWPGLRQLPSAVMPFSFILIACGVLTPNPTAVAAGKLLARPHPAQGIIRVTRHPVMWGIMLWAGAHILARGELKATVFFGSFLLLAAAGTRLQDMRKAKAHGEDWQRFAAITSNVPFVAIAQGRNRFAAGEIGLVRTAFGLLLYGGFLVSHAWLFGVRPY